MSSNPHPPASLSWLQRTVLVLVSLGVLGTFALSLTITPDPRGFGSHQQLGLPPCLFQMLFGIPCPGCGGTTSFAHFVRGEWMSSLRAHPAAFVGCLAGLLFVPWAIGSSIKGKPIFVKTTSSLLFWMLTTISLIAVLQWAPHLLH
ncbi:DUF2752 domain-containing protein [Planctomicrobium sp. SH668]|uniref:DUF2752 domain-containing protein n=1 Tax=Planctomicrobium sp. SH668 TaxID=3448126 RepID=UPI003F5C7D86